MNEKFNDNCKIIDFETWERREKYDFFMHGGCGFNITSPVDITKAYDYAKAHSVKLYSLLVAVTAKALNMHDCFKYGWKDDKFVCFDVVHPLIYELPEGHDAKCLCAEYDDNIIKQIDNIERVKEEYKGSFAFRPQKNIPQNSINISCVPWIETESITYCLKYCESYFAPIITFGRYEKKDGKVIIPLSAYLNHAVCDGFHAATLVKDFASLCDTL
ncbi:MAG: CatA-like O-acetyltransferase [Clostridia bacterium]|nr:CatA-like O-acetyltransferase [Clostridia bacterium]